MILSSVSVAIITLPFASVQVIAQAPPPDQAATQPSTTQPSTTQPSTTQPSTTQSSARQLIEGQNVLIIHSYSLDFTWTQHLKKGIDEGFGEDSETITLYHEFIDAKRYPDLHHAQAFLRYIEKKYEDTPLAAVMVSDDPGLNLILENRDRYLPNMPIIFMGINKFRPELIDMPWITGAFEIRQPIPTVIAAKQQTGSDNLIVITDSTSTGKGNRNRLEGLSNYPDAPSNVVVIEDLASSAIAQEIGKYPDHWPIFLAGQVRQDSRDGPLMNPEKDVALLREQVPNPIYTDTRPRVGNGAVGGQILDGQYHAQQAVQLVKQFLDGTPISEIEPLVENENRWVFDARELKRARIPKSQLPAGSVLLNEEPTFYERYRSLVWLAAIKFSLGLLTIAVLTRAIHRQKRAEKHLKENEKQLEQRVLDRTSELSKALEELKQTQAQLIHTEKLSSLGQLVGGVAHEFNNPLSFIHSNLKHIQRYIEDLLALVRLYQSENIQSQAIKDYIEEIELDYIQQDTPELIGSMRRGTKRIRDIVSALQKFSRSDEQGLKHTDLNQSIESTLLVLSTQLEQDIIITKDYATLPLVRCRPGDINQAVMNILLNSIAALEEDQRSASDRQRADIQKEKQIKIQTLASADDWVEIVIQDNGVGIPTDIQDKVFDPFFTTKPIGKGTGLGLALCYQIVQQHGGQMRLCSALGEGTTIRIGLPAKSSLSERTSSNHIQKRVAD